MLEKAGADEVHEIDVMVSRDVDQRQLREVIEQLFIKIDEKSGSCSLSELEQIAQDDELARLGADVIEELVELSRAAALLEVVAHAAIAEVEIADDEHVARRHLRIHLPASYQWQRIRTPARG